MQPILQAANELTPQQYGNYVITHILQNGYVSEKIQIIEAIIDNIVKFSMQQLGSNVIENCLKMAPSEYREAILERIISLPVASPPRSKSISLSTLMENQFGNYVVQHAYNLSTVDRKHILLEKIEQAASEGHVDRNNTYAKHVFVLIGYAASPAHSASATKSSTSENKRTRGKKATKKRDTIEESKNAPVSKQAKE